MAFLIVIFRIVHIIGISKILESSDKMDSRKVLRGSIYDRRGIALALTEEASTISLNPDEILDPEKTAGYLSGFIEIDTKDILQKIYLNQSKRHIILKRKIPNYLAEQIMELNLPGVYRNYEYRRIYPHSRLASNLIGFVRTDTLEGMAGLERAYHTLLMKNDKGFEGFSLELTIDLFLQYEMEKVMLDGFEKSKAEKAMGIFMNIHNGEILAMVNLPNFDPNHYYKENASEKGIWTLSFPFEPGSIMKPFFAAMLLNEDETSKYKNTYCDGEFSFLSGSVRCLRNNLKHSHGIVDLKKILEVSCNVGIIHITKNLSKSTIYKYLLELEFGKKTNLLGTELIESSGYLPKLENWVESTSYYLPIGQGMSATSIQIIKAFNSLVNGGRIVKPILVKKIFNSDYSIENLEKTSYINTSFRKKALNELEKYLVNVIHNGTGKLAKVDFIEVLGKTGSAQKAGPSGYTQKYTVSFIGIFPYPEPRYSLLIVYDGVSGDYTGGTLPAAIFANYLRAIKPFIVTRQNHQTIVLSDKIKLKNQKFTYNENYVPDFRGLSAKEINKWKEFILDIYNKKNNTRIEIQIYGNGYVVKQIPFPNTPLKDIKKIQIFLSDEN